MTRPPLIPWLLMRLLLAARVHEQVAGDLEEEWQAAPNRTRYWRLALASVYDARRRRGFSPDRRPTGGIQMQGTWHDVRDAARAMIRSPGFAAAAVLTLARGSRSTSTSAGTFRRYASSRPTTISAPT